METRIFDFSMIGKVLPDLLSYLDVTLLVGFSSILLGSLWGMVLAWGKLGGVRPLAWLAHGYTYIMRCTPSIVLLFIVFYGLPQLADVLLDVNINDLHRGVFAVLTFALLFGAYISEVFRAAYKAVPKGQYEAALCCGLSPWQGFFRIMLPQAAVVALPNFGNSVINLLKEGALAYTIGLIDLIGKGNLIISQNYGAFGVEIYLACMLIYWIISMLLEKLFFISEARLNKSRHLPVTANSQGKAAALLRNIWKYRKGAEAHGA